MGKIRIYLYFTIWLNCFFSINAINEPGNLFHSITENVYNSNNLNNTLSNTLTTSITQDIILSVEKGGKTFDGIGLVNGGGATSVLLKDYPEPQRSQILDLVYRPKFGASVSALLVEIPGDGNSTQGSMPSHMHSRNDLDYSRGYTWWILKEAKQRNAKLSLDATAWSAPGWIGNGKFWSQDGADYYLKWLLGLRSVYGLELEAIGCRNEHGKNYEFPKILRKTLNENGFDKVKIHAFDNWGAKKFEFVEEMLTDSSLRNSIDIISAHTFYAHLPVTKEIQKMAKEMNKPIWNTEDHVYKKGFECLIDIVKSFNLNYIQSGATKVVNWYDIAGIYPLQPYSEDPATILASWPWCGYYRVREALWGYAHYGQFTEVGWQYLDSGCRELASGGSMVSLKSPENEYSIIIETKNATAPQTLKFKVDSLLSNNSLCVWQSNEKEQFLKLPSIKRDKDYFTIRIQPNRVYSISTTTGQQKGSFENIPEEKAFPLPYFENFEEYTNPRQYGYLPRYTADIADAFELTDSPDRSGKCLHQVVPIPTNSWAPDWLPYTILGNENWTDYEVSADVYLNAGDSAAIMGRINHVGTGYGSIPKCYYLQLSEGGECRLVISRGKWDKKKLVGDAEQRSLLKKQTDSEEGGEKVLEIKSIPDIKIKRWYNLKLQFEGNKITGFVDNIPVVSAIDSLYSKGMVGLKAGGNRKKRCTPYFDNLLINKVNGSKPNPIQFESAYKTIYK